MPDLIVIAETLGGLGLFLLGMMLMTEGLRALAGDALRRQLMHFTRTPLSGAATGAACTALLQSSSATTVAAVGFVAAELMSFNNALGIIFGANIGTTITGWIVALVGFKLKLELLALPLVFGGVLLRLFGAARLRATGSALAGFALIFIGIDAMQDGMQGLEGSLPLDRFGGATFVDRLRLVGVGMLFTSVTPSSSAAVAASLTLLNAGMIDLGQGAALVIGADIGTTVTAGLATIGAATDARRTGLSHVIYNVMTGVLAMCLVAPYLWLVGRWLPDTLGSEPEFVLVAFHSGFNIIGVVMVLPVTAQFAALVERLVPRAEGEHAARLDPRLLAEPVLAMQTLHKAVAAVFVDVLQVLERALARESGPGEEALDRLERDLDACQAFAGAIDLRATKSGEWERQIALIHTLDHLQRLHERLEEEPLRIRTVRASAELAPERKALIETAQAVERAFAEGRLDAAAARGRVLNEQVQLRVAPYRDATAAAMARHEISLDTGTARLEAVRWLRRVSRHVARITYHLENAAAAAGK